MGRCSKNIKLTRVVTHCYNACCLMQCRVGFFSRTTKVFDGPGENLDTLTSMFQPLNLHATSPLALHASRTGVPTTDHPNVPGTRSYRLDLGTTMTEGPRAQ